MAKTDEIKKNSANPVLRGLLLKPESIIDDSAAGIKKNVDAFVKRAVKIGANTVFIYALACSEASGSYNRAFFDNI